MAGAVQAFLANVTEEAAKELEAAYLRIPEDKRNWSPMGDARTASDIIAECAILNDISEMVRTRKFPDVDFEAYGGAKTELAKDWGVLQAKFHEGTAKAVATIREVPDQDLTIEFPSPWGPLSIEQTLAYPYWNMSYHLGQINYLASMLGCLE